MKIGNKIRFLKTLDCGPTEDHPAKVYASKGETGQIVKVGECKEGFWVKTDSWPHAFGAEKSEFEVIDRLMICPQCTEEIEPIKLTRSDCNDCRGTGIGYPPPEAKCGRCLGRGYNIVEPFNACPSCYEPLDDE